MILTKPYLLLPITLTFIFFIPLVNTTLFRCGTRSFGSPFVERFSEATRDVQRFWEVVRDRSSSFESHFTSRPFEICSSPQISKGPVRLQFEDDTILYSP
jgi:hypothetical protein